MPSYNRYSYHARRALTHANLLVQRFRHASVDTGHLLVGIMLTEGSVGYMVLRDLKLTTALAEPHLRSLHEPPREIIEPANAGSPLEAALQLAADESGWLGHHYIGTEHLLLGITRTNLGSASSLLKLMAVTPETVRRQVRRALSDGLGEFTLPLAKKRASLSELSRRVINAAEQLAVSHDHPTVGQGHLLLMLLLERRSMTSTLLQEGGLMEAALRARLADKDPLALVSIEHSLEGALAQAEQLGSHYTGTEHLLLALTIDPAGQELLQAHGLTPEQVRQRLERKMRRNY